MAGPTISSLDLVPSGISLDEFAIESSGISEKITLSQISIFTNTSGILVSLSNDESPTSSTSMVRVSGMDVIIPSGMYTFEYYVRAQFANTTQSIKLAVNHTGTTTMFIYNMFHPGSLNTQANSSSDQERSGAAGAIYCVNTTRTKNTTLGPQASVDTINSDLLYRISGTAIITDLGTLQLFVGAESAANGNITIKSGTCLIVKKVG